jgi:hypothetical protein
MTPDPLGDQLLAIARIEVERLPYELDEGASRLLDAKIERGVATMRAEGRTGDEDVSLAEQHLRAMLQEAGGRAVVRAPGGAVVVKEGLESISPWWPF